MNKYVPALTLLLLGGCHPNIPSVAIPQGNTAYRVQLNAIDKANAPAIRRFYSMLRQENHLRHELFFHHITQQQYAKRTAPLSQWQAVIPPTRVALKKFTGIKPVPPEMRGTNSQVQLFVTSTNKGLDEFESWLKTKHAVYLVEAEGDLEIGYSSFVTGEHLLRDAMNHQQA